MTKQAVPDFDKFKEAIQKVLIEALSALPPHVVHEIVMDSWIQLRKEMALIKGEEQ